MDNELNASTVPNIGLLIEDSRSTDTDGIIANGSDAMLQSSTYGADTPLMIWFEDDASILRAFEEGSINMYFNAPGDMRQNIEGNMQEEAEGVVRRTFTEVPR